MPTVLVTLGRLPKGLDVIRGLSAMGCRVVVAEPFAWHLARTSRHVARSHRVPPPSDGKTAYLEALADIVAREQVDLVVPISEETMHVAFLRDRVPEAVRLFTMPPDAVLAVHDKGGFIRQGLAAGLAVPQTHDLGSAEAASLAAAGDVVVKPVFSCSGRGVQILRRGAALPATDPATPCVVQSFLRGREHSTCSIAHQGRVVSTAIYRGAIMSGSVAVCFERVAQQKSIEDFVARFVAATNWSGFIAFDFIVDDDGIAHGIECNPRSTSGVHFWQPASLARAILDPASATGVEFRPERELQQFWSCLTEAQGAMFRRDRFGERMRRLFATRDVTWDRRDPLPFLAMPATSWKIIAMSIARGTTFGEVATLDVGWYEDAPRAG